MTNRESSNQIKPNQSSLLPVIFFTNQNPDDMLSYNKFRHSEQLDVIRDLLKKEYPDLVGEEQTIVADIMIRYDEDVVRISRKFYPISEVPEDIRNGETPSLNFRTLTAKDFDTQSIHINPNANPIQEENSFRIKETEQDLKEEREKVV
jgi:hypothetical protein